MNEFIEQFIIESRDLIEQANAALNAIEQTPNDAESLDALFRAFHTLKGGASIVDFAAMERAVHFMEDKLTLLRANKLPLTHKSVDACTACLDQVARWLDRMEQVGEIPNGAEADTDSLIAAIGESAPISSVELPKSQDTYPEWVLTLLQCEPSVVNLARTAVRFTPHADCFLRGEDPLAAIAALPNLLALNLQPLEALPKLDELDPFQSILVLSALSAAQSDQVKELLQQHIDVIDVVALTTHMEHSDEALPNIARKILEAQVLLLEQVKPAMLAGCVGSAGRVAANIFRRCERTVIAEAIIRATEKSLAEGDALSLRNAIAESVLTKDRISVPVSPIAAQSLPRSLRVNADRIDEFVRLAGELTVIKNAFGHVTKLATSEENSLAAVLKKHHGTLEHITGELQRTALGMRVLPMGTVLQRFTRVVREMSADLQKPATLVVEGGDTEADKAIVEMLFEPLLHLIRNALDHGIEAAATRAARNKPATAAIRLSAFRVGDQVNIEIRDDGGGVDIDRVRSIAIDRGLTTAESAASMSEAEIVDFVFAPGFSTASKVTALSGRGVGMDAVRTAVSRIGGKVTLASSHAVGTTVRVTLPFSVLITHVMTVEADGQSFGIPLEAVVETVSVPVASIVGIGSARAIVRRGQTIPVFDLAGLLRVREGNRNKSDALIVIASIAGHLGGIEVDRLGERMEVILKPLEGMLSGIPGITGTTILGDGRVLLVLDLEGVMQ